MFELADYLVGIYKTYNCTKCVTVDLKKYYEKSGIAPPTQITSRDVHSTQMQKFSIQSQYKENGVTQTATAVQAPEEKRESNTATPYE